jgi:excisionase family DNA binding protein
VILYYERVEGYMTLEEMARSLGLKNAESLRRQVLRGVIRAERVGQRTYVITDEEVERYRREHLGKQGFASTSHPLHGKQGPGHRRTKGD